MKMSTKGRYGLRVMMELASRHGQGPVTVNAIADSQGISNKYIHLLIMGLRSSGLIRTVRGPGGGCELARDPASITALDVVSALEGPSTPVECVADTAACPRAGRCAARDVWRDVACAIDGVLSQVTLEQLSARQSAKSEESSSYCI